MTKLTTYTFALICLCVFAHTLAAQGIAPAGSLTSASLAGSVLKNERATMQGAYYESSRVISFDVYEQKGMMFCEFKTEFSCHSYAIEGKQGPFDEYKSLFYCHEDSCVDTRDRISASFLNSDRPCRYYRLKTVLANGEVHYSQTRFVNIAIPNEVEIQDPVVGSLLNLKFNIRGNMPVYSYSIAGMNGEVVRKQESLEGNAVDMEVLPAGIYFISFNADNGKHYHYKVLKTANL